MVLHPHPPNEMSGMFQTGKGTQSMIHEPTLFTAEATKDAIRRADEHADRRWRAVALRAIRHTAHTQPEFTADQIWQYLTLNAPDVTTHEPSALGPVFLRAAKLGWITNTGRTIERSIFSRRHRRLTIWQSHIHRP